MRRFAIGLPMPKRIFTLSAPPQAHTPIRKWCAISNQLSAPKRANKFSKPKAACQMRLSPVLVAGQMRLGFSIRFLMIRMWPSMVSKLQAKVLAAAFMLRHLPAEHRASCMATEPIFCKMMMGKSLMPIRFRLVWIIRESALNIHGFMILAASIMSVPPMKKRLSPFSFVRVLKASFRRSNHHMRWPILAPSLAIWILMILSF